MQNLLSALSCFERMNLMSVFGSCLSSVDVESRASRTWRAQPWDFCMRELHVGKGPMLRHNPHLTFENVTNSLPLLFGFETRPGQLAR